jgi:hypothetical protein
MKLQTIQYKKNQGWSVKQFPELDSEQTLLILFASPEFINHPEPILELHKAYPHSHMIGCSSAGEIFGESVLDESISVAIIKFEKTKLKIVKAKIDASQKSNQAGQEIAENLKDNALKNVFILSDGLNVNGTDLVEGLNSVLDKSVVVTGGLAGDGDRFKQTWSIFEGEIFKNHIVAVGFYGDHICIGHGSRGGWDSFGPERRVTRSKDNILYELDNRPALELYKEYLGERASGLPATGLLFPLAIRSNQYDKKQLVRTILAVDEENQSLIFAGDIPTGYFAQLMRANFDRLVNGATEAGELARQIMEISEISQFFQPVLCLAISCVGRRLLLGERTEEETEAALESLPKSTQQIGFYSYGELSPYGMGTCDLHNQTMTLTTISEKV